MSRFSKLAQRLRNGEFRYLFKRAFPKDNLIFFAGRQLIFCRRDHARMDNIYRRVAGRLDMTVTPVTEELQDKLFATFPEDAENFKRRFEKGANCYAAVYKGEFVAYMWVQQPANEYDTNSLWRFRPEPPGGNWCFDIYVKPEHRIKGVFAYLSGGAEAIYNKDGARPLYAETSYNNYKSIKAQTSVGNVKIMTVDFVSILGLRVYTILNHETGKRSFSCRFELDPASKRL